MCQDQPQQAFVFHRRYLDFNDVARGARHFANLKLQAQAFQYTADVLLLQH